MSKTTFFKRIAITAIAALGFGMLSVNPGQATVTSHSLTIDAATDSITLGDTATAVLTHQFVNLSTDGDDSVVLRAIVTSSNAANAGTILLTVTDSFTSTANDATAANSPRYSYGGTPFNRLYGNADSITAGFSVAGRAFGSEQDSVALGFSTAGAAAVYTGTSFNGTTYLRNYDANQVFVTPFGSTRDSITIAGGAADSNTVGTANRNNGTTLGLKLYNPTAAGTYVVSVYTQKSDNGAALTSDTPSVTWTVTVTEPTRTAAANSTATLRKTAVAIGSLQASGTFYGGTREGSDSATLGAATSTATDLIEEFALVVKQKSTVATNTARESYTVTVTGEAFVTAGTDAAGADVAVSTRPVTNSGGLKSVRMATPVADTATLVRIWSTGTAGTATVTVTTDSGLVIGTKTLTFHGTIAGIEKVAVYKNVIRSGVTTGSTSVIAIKVVDSGGRGVGGAAGTVAGVSSNLAAIASGTCTDAISYAGVATDTSTRDGTYWCDLTQSVGSVSGAAATITWRALKYLSTTEYWTVTQDVTMGGAPVTFTIATDKATYEPGEAMTVTVTAKDASGNTPYDLVAGPSITVNKAIGGTLSMSSYLGGKSTSNARDDDGTVTDKNNLFAPAASGKFMLTAQDGQDTPATVTASATVGDDGATAAANAASDAAAEAIDAANAATDAANLAAEAADAATVAAEEARDAADAATAAVAELAAQFASLVASVKAQITTLANTVAKIAKKVKA
jgi:hypothetical protein